MNKLIKKLSPNIEFAIVTIAGFGYFTYSSLLWFLYGLTGPADVSSTVINDSSLYALVQYEIIALLLIALFLKYRGWSIRDFNIQITWKLTGAGIFLAIFYYFIYYLICIIVGILFGPFENAWNDQATVNTSLSTAAILTISIINPIFEESLVVGYVLKALRYRKGVWYAINVSIIIRLLYHLYQGPLVAIAIVPLGWLFAYIFARWNRLWPLIVAHGLLDFIALYAN
jgi:membrane protease YdiL (CAAX protease family)